MSWNELIASLLNFQNIANILFVNAKPALPVSPTLMSLGNLVLPFPCVRFTDKQFAYLDSNQANWLTFCHPRDHLIQISTEYIAGFIELYKKNFVVLCVWLIVLLTVCHSVGQYSCHRKICTINRYLFMKPLKKQDQRIHYSFYFHNQI